MYIMVDLSLKITPLILLTLISTSKRSLWISCYYHISLCALERKLTESIICVHPLALCSSILSCLQNEELGKSGIITVSTTKPIIYRMRMSLLFLVDCRNRYCIFPNHGTNPAARNSLLSRLTWATVPARSQPRNRTFQTTYWKFNFSADRLSHERFQTMIYE